MDAISLIKRFEGCRRIAYRDEGGVWTVGWGCTGPSITDGTEWTQEQADAELEHRVERLQADMSRCLETDPTPGELAAMTSLAYNIGIAAFRFCTVARLFNAHDTQGSADAFLKWCNVKGHPSMGLIKRRQEERAIFLGKP